MNPNPTVYSDADQEIIVNISFVSPVHLRKICIIGGSNGSHPNELRCFVNRSHVDFTEINDIQPTQIFAVPINMDGNAELITAVHPFTNIQSLALYFPSNHGDEDATSIKYIGLQGEHTHFRREAVDTIYEVLCTGEELREASDISGIQSHFH